MKNEPKTNATRILDVKHVPYRVHTYEVADGAIDARAVAAKIDVPEQSLFKTLVGRASGGVSAGRIFVFCIPGPSELDFNLAARCCAAKSVELVHVQELLGLTGYVRGGCSPIGMKRPYPVFVDDSATLLREITVSAGKIGVQISLAPDSLAALAQAEYARLTKA